MTTIEKYLKACKKENIRHINALRNLAIKFTKKIKHK